MNKKRSFFELIICAVTVVMIFSISGFSGISNTDVKYWKTKLVNTSETDSLHLKIYLSDREYFLKLQETVSSKNQYIGLQWCIDLLNKYISLEEQKLKESHKSDE
jgi:hypothetical protein